MRVMLAVLMLTVLCGVTAAEEAKITLKVEGAPLRTVAGEIAKQSKLSVVVDPDRAAAKITLSLAGVPVGQALARVAAAAKAQIVRLASSAVWIGRALEVWERRTQATLVLTTLSVAFKDKPIGRALKFVTDETSVPVALDPEVTRTRERDTLVLTLKAEDIRGRDLLDLVAESLNLAWDVRYGVVFISTKERLASLPRDGMDPPRADRTADWEAMLRRRLVAETVFFDFKGSSAVSALYYLSKTGNIPIVFADDIKVALAKSTMVIQKVEGINFQQALDLVLIPRGFKYEPTKEGVRVLRRR